MNELELKNLWHTSNERLEMGMATLNQNTQDITQLKVNSILSTMKPLKVFTILVGVLWVGVGGVVIANLFQYALAGVSLFFLISATVQVGLTGFALVIYLYQLINIYQVDITEPIVSTQERLARLRTSQLWVARIMLLQLPAWVTMFVSTEKILSGDLPYIIINSLMFVAFAACSLWLFFNIKYENKDKKWFRLIFQGKEWDPILQSMALLSEVQKFKG